MNFRITTFNLENLYSRYLVLDDVQGREGARVQLVGVASLDAADRPESQAITQSQRNNTARAILEAAPDVLAVQEVENLRWLAHALHHRMCAASIGTKASGWWGTIRGV